MELPGRNQVPVERTWDLTALCPDEAAFSARVQRAGELTDRLE